jgi:four helix bundle protein
MVHQPYEDLVAWQKAMDLVVAVYRASERFPQREQFGLTSQVRRAAVSVPSNIAEGHGRTTDRQYLQHALIAHGSLREVETQLKIAERLNFLDASTLVDLLRLCDDTGRPLRGLIHYLRERSNGRTIGEELENAYDIDF